MVKHVHRSALVVLLVAAGVAATVAGSGTAVPLIEAVKTSDTATIRRLLKERADVNAAEADGTTALHWAARANDATTVQLLIAAGANVKAVNRYQVAPLSVACMSG